MVDTITQSRDHVISTIHVITVIVAGCGLGRGSCFSVAAGRTRSSQLCLRSVSPYRTYSALCSLTSCMDRTILGNLGLAIGFIYIYICICMYDYTYSKSMDQPGKVASPARGQLNRENEYFSIPVRA